MRQARCSKCGKTFDSKVLDDATPVTCFECDVNQELSDVCDEIGTQLAALRAAKDANDFDTFVQCMKDIEVYVFDWLAKE